MRVYLDTNFFIRYVESADAGLAAFIERAEAGSWQLFTSEFTLAEVLVMPLRDRDAELTKVYEEMLVSDELLTIVPVDRQILRVSAAIRAAIGNQPADAVHVATASMASCSLMLSSDVRLKLPDDMVRIALQDVATIGIGA